MKSTNRLMINLLIIPASIITGSILGVTPVCYGFDEFDAMKKIQEMYQGQVDTTAQYIELQGPALQQKYNEFNRNYPNTMTFYEFAYRDMMSGGGTNPGAALQLQHDTFNKLQESHRGMAGAYNAQNQAWQQNQDILGQVYRNYHHGTMGTWLYPNPYGGTNTLPYSYGPSIQYRGTQPIYQNPAGGYMMPTPSYNYYLYPAR